MALLPTCPLCATDEFAVLSTTGDGRTYALCSGPAHPKEWEFEPIDARRDRTRTDGLGQELGIWDKLLMCVTPGEGAIAYGVVEDRLFEKHPDVATALLRTYGHRFRDPAHPSTQYSMSAYLAARLRELANEGALSLTWARAEGQWSHNGVISHWERR